MNLYQLKGSKIDFVGLNPFKVEKDIQDIVEKNTQEFFSLEFVRSEFSVGGFRIDTLCYNNETNSFVIIEYKRGNSYSIIDQGYSYLSLMLNNKSEFIIEYNERLNKKLRRDDIDWTQSRIIFISQSFSSYQKNSINFKNLPFELWEIKRFKNDTIVLNQQISNSKEGIDTLVNIDSNTEFDEVNKEIKVIDEEFHTSKLDVGTKEKWEQLKERICELDGVSVQVKKYYISFVDDNKTICYVNFRKHHMTIGMGRGNVNPDGTKSKNYFDIDDPKGISEEGSWEWKSGVKGNVYNIKFNKDSDLDYTMFLINQKFNSL
jgi:predicted transport protein